MENITIRSTEIRSFLQKLTANDPHSISEMLCTGVYVVNSHVYIGYVRPSCVDTLSSDFDPELNDIGGTWCYTAACKSSTRQIYKGHYYDTLFAMYYIKYKNKYAVVDRLSFFDLPQDLLKARQELLIPKFFSYVPDMELFTIYFLDKPFEPEGFHDLLELSNTPYRLMQDEETDAKWNYAIYRYFTTTSNSNTVLHFAHTNNIFDKEGEHLDVTLQRIKYNLDKQDGFGYIEIADMSSILLKAKKHSSQDIPEYQYDLFRAEDVKKFESQWNFASSENPDVMLA